MAPNLVNGTEAKSVESVYKPNWPEKNTYDWFVGFTIISTIEGGENPYNNKKSRDYRSQNPLTHGSGLRGTADQLGYMRTTRYDHDTQDGRNPTPPKTP